jgi:hypothetical protein
MSKLIGDLYYILNNDNKTATLIFSNASDNYKNNYSNLIDKDIIIPPKINDDNQPPPNTYDVTSIGDSAFKYSKIKSIVIPKSVTSIGNFAFLDSSLKSITFEGTKPKFGTGIFYDIGNVLNPSFGYIDKNDNSWKGINHIDDLIIRNTSSYSKSIISIIICLILLFMIYTSNTSGGYKYSLYIIIIISSLIFNKNFNTTFFLDYEDKKILPSIIHIILSFLLFFIALIPMYSLLKLLLFGFFGLIYFLYILYIYFLD